jgi:hypothetical protein
MRAEFAFAVWRALQRFSDRRLELLELGLAPIDLAFQFSPNARRSRRAPERASVLAFASCTFIGG